MYSEVRTEGQEREKKKKKRFALPKNGFIHSEDASKLLLSTTQNSFWFHPPVSFSPGPSRAPLVISHISACNENQPGSAVQGPGLERTAENTFWFSLNSPPGFPRLPDFHFNSVICCICWGPATPAAQTLQYYHSISVRTLGWAKKEMVPETLNTWGMTRNTIPFLKMGNKTKSILTRMFSCLANGQIWVYFTFRCYYLICQIFLLCLDIHLEHFFFTS